MDQVYLVSRFPSLHLTSMKNSWPSFSLWIHNLHLYAFCFTSTDVQTVNCFTSTDVQIVNNITKILNYTYTHRHPRVHNRYTNATTDYLIPFIQWKLRRKVKSQRHKWCVRSYMTQSLWGKHARGGNFWNYVAWHR